MAPASCQTLSTFYPAVAIGIVAAVFGMLGAVLAVLWQLFSELEEVGGARDGGWRRLGMHGGGRFFSLSLFLCASS